MERLKHKSRKYWRYLAAMARKAGSLDRHFLRRGLAGSRDAVVALAAAPARLIVDLEDSVMSRSLLMTGVYEPHVTRVFRDLVKPDANILDIGANIGYFSVLGASLAPRGKVFAFEPDPGNFRRLMANLYLNGLHGRVDALNAAVGERAAEIMLTNLDAGNAGGRLTVDDAGQVEALFGKGFAAVPVPCVVLDDRLAEQRIDLIKIDIEGYEPKAFAGMGRLLDRHHPAILSEFSPNNLANIGGMAPEAFLGFFLRKGYGLNVIEFETGDLVPMAGPGPLMEYWRGLGYDHLDVLFKAA